MKWLATLLLATALTGGHALAQTAPITIPASLDVLIKAAEKEGRLDLVWTDSVLGDADAVAPHAAKFNAMFKTHIQIKYSPGPELARFANQLFTEFQAGQPATSDLYIGAATQMLQLLTRDMFFPVPWHTLQPDRISAEMVEYDSHVLRIQSAVSGVTYNSDLIPHPPANVADFLKPEWKGKIATTPYAGGYDTLAAKDLWGPEKTLDFVRQLSTQAAGLMRCGDAEHIATGEFQALVMDCVSNTATAWQERGAPVAFMIPRDAAQYRYYYAAVPRHARHPAAAALFSLYLDSADAQAIMWQTVKVDLASLPGSHMASLFNKAKADGIVFTEVTVDWWAKHPEVDQTKSEMIKLIGKK